MEPWFAEAKPITSLDAEIGFLLQKDFYYGPDSFPEATERKLVEPLPSPNIARHTPSMVRSAEAMGYEDELANYYREVISVAKEHRKAFKDIEQYFWLRFWLWNTEENVRISFPWYDTLSEIDQFVGSVSKNAEGRIFWDSDQGWELEVHALDGELFFRERNPDDDVTHAVIKFSQATLVEQLQLVRARTEPIIQFLSSAIGKDVWTRRVDWPDFCPKKPRVWWKLWRGATNR